MAGFIMFASLIVIVINLLGMVVGTIFNIWPSNWVNGWTVVTVGEAVIWCSVVGLGIVGFCLGWDKDGASR